MSNETKHTPGPWHLRTANGRLPVVRESKRPHGEASHYRAVIGSGDTLGGPVIVDLDFGYGKPEDQANAEFIVRACNAHDDLLAALKAMLSEYGDVGDESILAEDEPNHPVILAHAAIAKAEGK